MSSTLEDKMLNNINSALSQYMTNADKGTEHVQEAQTTTSAQTTTDETGAKDAAASTERQAQIDLSQITPETLSQLGQKMYSEGKISKGEMLLMEFEQYKPQIQAQVEALFNRQPGGSYQEFQTLDVTRILEQKIEQLDEGDEQKELSNLLDKLKQEDGKLSQFQPSIRAHI